MELMEPMEPMEPMELMAKAPEHQAAQMPHLGRKFGKRIWEDGAMQ